MKRNLVLATLIATVSCGILSGGEWAGGLRVHFDTGTLGLGFGSKFMYNVPKTVSEAVTEGWTQETRPNDGYHPSLVMYCHSPPVLCGLYDDTEYVAGLNIALSQEIFTNYTFDLALSGFTEWTDSDNIKYWTIQEFFVSEDFLATDKDTRLASRNSKKMYQQDSVWVAGMNNQLYTIPTSLADITNTAFTKQACIPWMGLHYYYNMTTNTECSAETILPWFPMYDDGTLVGVGFMTFGVMSTGKGDREWFEKPAESAVKVIVNNGPQCLYDLAASPGALTMHTYFVENPRLILCLNN